MRVELMSEQFNDRQMTENVRFQIAIETQSVAIKTKFYITTNMCSNLRIIHHDVEFITYQILRTQSQVVGYMFHRRRLKRCNDLNPDDKGQ